MEELHVFTNRKPAGLKLICLEAFPSLSVPGPLMLLLRQLTMANSSIHVNALSPMEAVSGAGGPHAANDALDPAKR
jgi:hypothetical protein